MTASRQPSAPELCFIYSPVRCHNPPGVLYADNGFWDTFRTVYPLRALLFPDKLSEIVNSWVQAANEGGHFAKWASPGYRNCMGGTHLDEEDLPCSLSMVGL
jgi:putative alpha-1,2-mannosidase